MFSKTAFVFTIIAISALSNAQMDISLNQKDVISTDSKTSTDVPTPTAAPTVPSSTEIVPTPKPTDTSSTPKPTPAPTPEPSTTQSPTPEPSTTPTPAPSPTPTPKPKPADIGTWSYTEQNETCIIMKFAMQLNVTYKTKDNNDSVYIYNVPSSNHSNVLKGSCGNESQYIIIEWDNKGKSSIEIDFNLVSGKFALNKLIIKLNASAEIVDAKENQIIELTHNVANFTTPIKMSYHCTRPQILNVENSTDTIQMSHLQLEAFHKGLDEHFSTARDCDAIDTPDIVPIAVGLALAALVIVVLIAYLVARRRSQARGYLSM